MATFHHAVLHILRAFLVPLKSVRQISLLLLVVIIFITQPTPVMAARFVVQGISGELAKNVKVFLAALPEPAPDDLDNYLDLVKKNTRQAMQALGYYKPVISTVVKRDQQNLTSIHVDIAAGSPVRVTSLDLQITGEAEQDPEFHKAIRRNRLRKGEPFHHGHYEETKSLISELANSRGYFDAQWVTALVEISIRKNSARITMLFDSRTRYHFGEISIDGDPELHDLITKTRSFETGEPYSSALLAEYNARLNDTNYFRSILVQPDLEHRADGLVPVTVRATPYASNIFNVGGGFSTDIGPRGKLKWTVPRLNRAGHSLVSKLEISAPEQNFVASYKVPIEDLHANYRLLQAGYQHQDNGDTNTNKYTLQAKRLKRLGGGWERAYVLRYELEDFRQGEQTDISHLIMPGLSFTRDRSRGGLNVLWGDSLRFYLELSDPSWGSDVRLAKFRSRIKWVRTAGENNKHKFIARSDLGGISVKSIYDVPASLRFFTGGDQSIRGFRYGKIAPQDDTGLLIGGKYLAVGSLEYGYLILEKWRIAGFIDAGTATNDFSESISVGSGVGLRWITPVGPLRLDLAYAISESDKPWMIHFSMGPDI